MLSVQPYFLEFIRPFALAHGTRKGTQLAFVKLESQGIVSYGEASLPPYLNETFETVKKWVENQRDRVAEILHSDLFANPEIIPFSAQHPAASAALQSAVLHWCAAAAGKKLSDFFETTESNPGLTLTITKNDFPFLSEKWKFADHFTHLKLKLTGHDDDLEFVKALRQKNTFPFCVDFNQGYEKREQAIRLISALELLGCVLMEQPLKSHDHEGHFWLKQRTSLPVIADESIRMLDDLIQYHDAYSGVNIKLMKCGGLFQAQEMLRFRPQGSTGSDTGPAYLKLLGCMTESSLGVSTAAVLLSQCDLADLDAPYLTRNDPFSGFQITHQKILLEDRIIPKHAFLSASDKL